MPDNLQMEDDYGTKIEYDPQWHGPLLIKRKVTNLPFLIILIIFLAAWIGIGIYAFSLSTQISEQVSETKYLDSIKREFEPHIENYFSTTGYKTVPSFYVYPRSYAVSKVDYHGYVAGQFIILAVIMSVTYIILLRWFTKFIVYTILFIICSVLIIGVVGLAVLYLQDTNRWELLIPLFICAIMLLIIITFILLARRLIDIACEVIKESSKVVMYFPTSLFLPVLSSVLYILVITFAVFVLYHLLNISTQQQDFPGNVIYFYHFMNWFCFFWLGSFITSCFQMILSGSFGTWYWTLNKSLVPNTTILQCMGITFRYHLGTVAVGSLVTAICRIVNCFCKSISQRGSNSCCCILTIFRCFFKNLETFVKYINRNAFIMTAIHGTSFFKSAKDAFNLLMRNILKVYAINKVTDAILILGILCIVPVSTLSTFYYCQYHQMYDNLIQTLTIVLISSFVIAASFLNVLRIAIDTIFLCVLEDFERNDGTEVKPYYMNIKLRILLFKQEF